MTALCARMRRCSALPVQGGFTSLCARTRGEPVCACRFNQCVLHALPLKAGGRAPPTASRSCRPATRFQRRVTTCPHENEEKDTPHSSPAHPHAAQRAVTGWRGGLGGVGADLASAGSMRPPPSPARHVSTARLATTKVSQETVAPPQKPGKKQHATAAQRGSPTHTPTEKRAITPINGTTHTTEKASPKTTPDNKPNPGYAPIAYTPCMAPCNRCLMHRNRETRS